MTNAFSTRHQNKDKTKELRRSIQHVLDENEYGEKYKIYGRFA